jgi:hypothetical protein
MRVHEDVAECLPVRRRCCQIQLSRSCGLIHLAGTGTTGIESVSFTVSMPLPASRSILGVPTSTTKEASASTDYDGRQYVGIDLHRRRTVIVRSDRLRRLAK